MTAVDVLCDQCQERPAHPGTWLCDRCTDWLHGDLHRAVEWHAELEVERLGQSRKGAGGGSRPTETALPYSPEASAAQAALVAALHELAVVGGLPRHGTLDLMVEVLLTHEDRLTRSDGVGAASWHLRDATRTAARLCGKPPERAYIGDCPTCSERLTAPLDAPVVHCRQCGQKTDADAMRQAQLDLVRDQWLSIDDIAALLKTPRGTVWHWADGGHLQRHESDPRLFRLGDAIDRKYRHPASSA